MNARFAGTCKACGRPYAKGDRITVLAARGPRGGKQWGHASCAAAAPYVGPTGGRCTAFRWTTALDVAAAVKPEHRTYSEFDGDDYDASVRLVTQGDHRPETIARIAKAREKARDVLLRATERPTWSRDFAGYAVSVPHLLSGSPRCMLRPAMEASATAPIRIWVDPTASASTSKEDMDKRAGTIAGIAEALSAHRPVEVIAFRTTSTGSSDARRDIRTGWQYLVDAWCVKLDWRDPAFLAPMLGGPYSRGICLRFKRGTPGADATAAVIGADQIVGRRGDLADYVATMRTMLPEAGPDDLVIPYQIAHIRPTTADGILDAVLRLYGAETLAATD